MEVIDPCDVGIYRIRGAEGIGLRLGYDRQKQQTGGD
jgi:hypothetical protein